MSLVTSTRRGTGTRQGQGAGTEHTNSDAYRPLLGALPGLQCLALYGPGEHWDPVVDWHLVRRLPSLPRQVVVSHCLTADFHLCSARADGQAAVPGPRGPPAPGEEAQPPGSPDQGLRGPSSRARDKLGLQKGKIQEQV